MSKVWNSVSLNFGIVCISIYTRSILHEIKEHLFCGASVPELLSKATVIASAEHVWIMINP